MDHVESSPGVKNLKEVDVSYVHHVKRRPGLRNLEDYVELRWVFRNLEDDDV